MAGLWQTITDELAATFRVEGCLDARELESLSSDLRRAAQSGYRHLILDLNNSCEQSVHHWAAFRPVLEELTSHGAHLTVEGATPDLRDGLQSAAMEAKMRWLERQHPDIISKVP